jgi:hypothetical protein
VGVKNFKEYAVRRVDTLVTTIGPSDAPGGTVTMSDVAELAFTDARTLPKKTILFEATVLKFEPVIVIEEPTGPLIGEKDEIVGADETTAGICALTDQLLIPSKPVESTAPIR